ARRQKAVWQSGMVRWRAASRHGTRHEEQRQDRRIRQLSGPAQCSGSLVISPGWPQPQVRFSEFLGTLQPNSLGQRGSVSTLPERRTGYRDTASDSRSMEGPPERRPGGLWTGCLDYGKDHDHLWPAMGVSQRTGFRPTCTEWAL